MTTATIAQLAAPSTVRAARVFDSAGERAVDGLAGRTVWCAFDTSRHSAAADALSSCLGQIGTPPVVCGSLELSPLEPQIPESVRPGDVVVLHAMNPGALAPAIRDRGAYAVVRIEDQPSTLPQARVRGAAGYVASWRTPGIHGLVAESILALIPSPAQMTVLDLIGDIASWESLGWSSVLADVVLLEHDEIAGGTLHPRPKVPVR